VVRAMNYDVINMDGELERNAEEIVNLSTAGITSLVDRFANGLTALYVNVCYGGATICVFCNCFFHRFDNNDLIISRTRSLH